MNKLHRLLLGMLLTLPPLAPMQVAAADSRSENFNSGWTFSPGDCTEASSPGFDDSQWRKLSLPHDWAIEGRFSADNPSGTGGGALPGGIGWYRKTFRIDSDIKDKQVFIDFDGAYMNATVYFNGHELGTRPYGYASFSYNITPWLNPIGENTLAVRVDNAEQPNSRWYSGCGIYRNVWLRIVDDCHIMKDGVQVVANPDGDVTIACDADNLSPKKRKSKVNIRIKAPDGTTVASKDTTVSFKKKSETAFANSLHVDSPLLWSPNTPNLYTVEVTLGADRPCSQKFGFRSFEFDAKNGFSLNGEPMKINGVCLHHDAGALGAVVNRTAIRRQLKMMKDMGANAVRTTHNPFAPEFLDLCDELGLMVMDDSFDMWRKRKSAHDYSRYFDEWHERDLTDLVKRDRNHPSVIIWNIGNEVLEQWSDAKADSLSLEEANLILNFGHSKEMLAAEGDDMSVNSLLTKKLADIVKGLDSTRPITAGCNEPDPGNHLFRSGALDIIGFNYHDDWFKDVPKNFPGKPFIVSESVSALMTRGFYVMPSDSVIICPERWDKPYFDASYQCSAYDNCHVPWGNSHEGTMRHVKNNDFISGQFVWTGFDYIGEPTPYGWPARSSYFGIVDLAGFPKDVYYMYKSEWQPDSTVLHILPHWNWKEGQNVDVWAYYNNADEVELFINGKSQGTKKKGADDFHVVWNTVFEPGTLTAVSRKDGWEVSRKEVRTAGLPYAVRLTPDRTEVRADGYDLCYVTAEIVDKDGNVCPWATDVITFNVEGAGFNAGVDNGSPISLEPFKSDHRKAFYGKALLIVQSDGSEGIVTVTATAPGLKSSNVNISSTK